ncbi:hypothetical protein Zmor_005143 [Zophobas morio]|uniref:Transmembrane protein n=1 Tax=Zophobas morio TaxID=2755281 RepID=A0AA38IPD8_9CUCU|nr:hypothetical protein Zmor_005143 [Zophobas morio]
MSLNDIENWVKKIACSLGILQGLAYAILALICIIVYNDTPPNLPENSYMDMLNAFWYTFYLGPNLRSFEDQTLYPRVFAGFAWVYLILHIIWIGVSVFALREQNTQVQKYLKLWSYITFVISLWDFLVVIIFGSDYGKCLSYVDKYFWIPTEKIANQLICANAVLPVLVIAARGFVLWVVNVILAAATLNMSRRFKTPVQPPAYVSPIGFHIQHPVGQPLPDRPQPVTCSLPPPPNSQYPVQIPEPDYDWPSSPFRK